MLFMFFGSVGLEMSCGAWGATYLVESGGLSTGAASGTIMFYFLGIAIGRFLSGILSMKWHCWTIVRLSMCVLIIALLLLIFFDQIWITTVALMLIGIGNGPMFPSFSYLTPENFGRENSLSAMGIQIAVANVSLMLMPVLCGFLCQQFSMSLFPYFLLGCYVLMVLAYQKRPAN